jgi:hypothetical protein
LILEILVVNYLISMFWVVSRERLREQRVFWAVFCQVGALRDELLIGVQHDIEPLEAS